MPQRLETPNGDGFCEGVIISSNHILTYQCPSFFFDGEVSLFFRRRNVIENAHFFGMKVWPSKTIKNPIWIKKDDFYLLKLDKPLELSTKHAPICISNHIPKKNIPNPIYFNWETKKHLNEEGSIRAIVHHSKISKHRKW